jgi:protein associated with RNAse G/E
VKLVPDRDWYQLSYFGRGRSHELYVDVTTEARWTTPGLVQAVDLDLDVIRHGDGTTAVLDRNELGLHRRPRAYPLDIVDGGEASGAAVVAAVEHRRVPFVGTAEDWLQRNLAG